MEQKKKVYVSGKITGDPNYVEKFTKIQRALETTGYTVLNPIIYPEGLTWEEYMHLSYAMIDCADIIYLLPDWEDSKGAKLEYEYGVKHNKLIYLSGTELPKQNYWFNICKIQKAQLAKGLKKYGYPLEQNPMEIIDRLQYLEEELVDALMYIEHIKEALNANQNSK